MTEPRILPGYNLLFLMSGLVFWPNSLILCHHFYKFASSSLKSGDRFNMHLRKHHSYWEALGVQRLLLRSLHVWTHSLSHTLSQFEIHGVSSLVYRLAEPQNSSWVLANNTKDTPYITNFFTNSFYPLFWDASASVHNRNNINVCLSCFICFMKQ